MSFKLERPLVVLDLETTGTWIEKDKIVEIGMIRCAPDGEQKTFHRRVNPTIPIPPVVVELIGITNDDVKDAPEFGQIAREVLEFIGDADLAGFNIERFDLPLLEREMNEAGVRFAWRDRAVYDAQMIFHLHEKRDLAAAYQFYCKKDIECAHSAIGDCTATLEVLQAQIGAYCEKGDIGELRQFKYRQHSEFYDSEKRFRWWNGKLYMMFGKYARRLSLQEVAKRDPGYLQWIMSADFSAEVKELVGAALKGQFPVYSSDT